MNRIPLIKAVMTPFPTSIGVGEPISRARQMMVEYDVRHLPVVEGDELVSVVSEREITQAQELSADGRPEPKVRDVCSGKAYIVPTTERLDRVLQQMAEQHLHVALVVKDGRLAGIFTTTDACHEFVQLLRTLFPRGGDDAA